MVDSYILSIGALFYIINMRHFILLDLFYWDVT